MLFKGNRSAFCGLGMFSKEVERICYYLSLLIIPPFPSGSSSSEFHLMMETTAHGFSNAYPDHLSTSMDGRENGIRTAHCTL